MFINHTDPDANLDVPSFSKYVAIGEYSVPVRVTPDSQLPRVVRGAKRAGWIVLPWWQTPSFCKGWLQRGGLSKGQEARYAAICRRESLYVWEERGGV